SSPRGHATYGGTSAVALYLGHGHEAAGGPAARRASLGAIHHAIATLDRLNGPGGAGLYTGRLGVALAAAWVGAVLQEGGLLEQAASIVDRLEPFDGKEYDLLSAEPEPSWACSYRGGCLTTMSCWAGAS